MHEFDAKAPAGVKSFPEAPPEFSPIGPELWPALRDARESTDQRADLDAQVAEEAVAAGGDDASVAEAIAGGRVGGAGGSSPDRPGVVKRGAVVFFQT